MCGLFGSDENEIWPVLTRTVSLDRDPRPLSVAAGIHEVLEPRPPLRRSVPAAPLAQILALCLHVAERADAVAFNKKVSTLKIHHLVPT